MKFTELGISESILQAIADMGFCEPTPIQKEAIPLALQGKDIVGMAQTGTGKTAAFAIPALEKIHEENKKPQVLVLCPTRELALQVTDTFEKLAKYKKISVVTLYGGDPIERQIKALKAGVQVVVGTPGRIIDHLERKTFITEQIHTVILDEADEMLDMGFREDVEAILEQMPTQRQTLLFSATMSKQILSIVKKYQNDPQIVKVIRNELTAENIEQLFYEIKADAKIEVMCRLIDFYNLEQVIVFCNTKKKVDEVAFALMERGYTAEAIHGDLTQRQREKVMKQFREGSITILVATDVAARGIDIAGVDAVFNHDIPLDPEYYVHRIGRTGRAGKSGKAFTFVVGKEIFRLREIQEFTNKKIGRGVVPSIKDLIGIKQAHFVEAVAQIIQSQDLSEFEPILTQLRHKGFRDEAIIKALIQMQWQHQKNKYLDIEIQDHKFKKRTSRETLHTTNGNLNKNTVRLFMNIGRLDQVRPNDIINSFTEKVGLLPKDIGQINILEKFSFVEIPRKELEKVIHKDILIKGKVVNVQLARQEKQET